MTNKYIDISLDNSVLVIRFTNDSSRNSLTAEMREGLSKAIHDAATDPTVRAIYITGSGKSFCSGGDFETLKAFNDSVSTHYRFQHMASFLISMMRMQKPVVIGVNGVAVGGGIGLALAGDVLFAAESARFISGFMRIGVMPDHGIMYNLPRLVGMGRAKNFIFGNETWSAQQALEYGLISKVLPDDELDATALEHAHALSKMPVEAIGVAKFIMGRSFENSLENMLAMESLGQPFTYRTEAFQEGFDALLEKRSADFPAASEKETWTQHVRNAREDD